MRPLTLTDFFAPLSELYCGSVSEYEMFCKFTHTITGIKERLDAIAEGDDPKKKKKKKR